MDAKLAVSRLITETPRPEKRKIIRASHNCPYCQCHRQVLQPCGGHCDNFGIQNFDHTIQNSRSFKNIITVMGPNVTRDRVTLFKSSSPRARKITIRYQSPPREAQRNLAYMPYANYENLQHQLQPRPRILDKNKKNKRLPTHMEITFNPVKALHKTYQTQFTSPHTTRDSFQTPGRAGGSSTASERLRLGYSKKTYLSISGDRRSQTSLQENF